MIELEAGRGIKGSEGCGSAAWRRSRDEESGPGFGLRAWGIVGIGIRPWASRGFGRGRAEGKSVWEPRFAGELGVRES
ncbi:hypothetical protein CDL15_Pgr017060 [Punica granatum]|nr:hypothetical protein CDL15_Pgr017060 [Punica granatum]